MTYILLAGVVVVWGLIFVRIYSSLFSDSKEITSSKPVIKGNQNIFKKDTFVLVAKYRDPFLGGMHNPSSYVALKDPGKKNNIKPVVVKTKEPEVQIDWTVISYIGLIKNTGSNKHVSLMNINGNEYLMEEGVEKEGVKLMRNCKDSVKVVFCGKEKFIKRN
ncbi:hypothetical protein Solca_1594 [Sporocytophaga myxococcoides]|uniref:Uncharacterized protein n=2 Tax=Sporocytophaga myxococcoides TaxID=153721 RepID=A0A098LFA8_9BACT|nr:hypothetical protein Solca_1594 [Sporocytophaga myxococcoides]